MDNKVKLQIHVLAFQDTVLQDYYKLAAWPGC